MSRIVHVNQRLCDMPTDQARQWSTWLTQHGLDPHRMLVGTVIYINDQARTVETTYPTPNGMPVYQPRQEA